MTVLSPAARYVDRGVGPEQFAAFVMKAFAARFIEVGAVGS